MRKKEGKNNGADRDGNVKCNFCHAKIGVPCAGHCANERFTGKHGNIGQNFQINAKSQNHTSKDQADQLDEVGRGIQRGKQDHGKINKVAKGNGNWNLEQMF